jgi:16S rRNA processing protein RimM
MKRYLECGKIVTTHGIRGEVKVQPWCDSSKTFASLKTLYWDKDGTKPVKVRSRAQGEMAITKLEGCDSIEQAVTYRNRILYADREDFHLAKGAYFVQDLLGMEVFDADTKVRYGKISDVLPTGANDVYEITDDEGKTYLIPAIPQVLEEICVEENRMTIRPMKGIFDDEV